MATTEVVIPDKLAEALGRLEKPIEADDVAFASLLRWAVHEVAWELEGIYESESDLDPAGMRRLAKRIEVLADAAEAVAC